jgi:hypothetical protein
MRYNTFLMVQQYPYHSRRKQFWPFKFRSFGSLHVNELEELSATAADRSDMLDLRIQLEIPADNTLNDDYDNYHPSSGSHCPETP